MALSAALFDLDGTLLDSNDAHVRAWHTALHEHDYNVAPDRIAIEIGKGGDQLVTDLLGASAETADGDALRSAHDHAFREIAESEGLRPLPGARQLLAELRGRGMKLALATSTSGDGLALCERTSGVSWRSMFDVVANADDVAATKPAPDIVTAAVEKLGVSPAECVMVGDTPWDAQSAKHAGVVLIGVLCGGNLEGALVRAGSRAVYRDPAAIYVRLDEALRRASPGRALLDAGRLGALMQAALEAAAIGMDAGEVPIGAVLANGDGAVVARGWNRLNHSHDRAAHAELDAFRNAASKLDPGARDTILVSTLEPCVMCLGAAMETAVDTVIYGLRAPEDSGTGRVQPPENADNQMPRIVGDVRAAESRALLETWLGKSGRNPDQEPFVRALLARQA